jgi:ATP-dependent DNA helicase RecQ
MKYQQTIRVNYDRREAPDGGEFAALDSLTQGRVNIIETPSQVYDEVELALAELIRLNKLANSGQTSHWGRFAVIARHWDVLEPMATLCRQKGIPVRLMRDEHLLDLHSTREGYSLLSLLNNQHRHARKLRVLLHCGALSRWFKYRYRQNVDDLIEHPYQAMLAQFIISCESVAPGSQQQVVSNIIEALYEFRSGNQSGENDSRHAPLLLLTSHRAKGLEFDHVLILDAGGWKTANEDERRLYYVAMTRARKTLTLCARKGGRHAFVRDCEDLCLKTQPKPASESHQLGQRTWVADPAQVVLSWPGYFAPNKPIHRAISQLNVGSELLLRPRNDGKTGWELTDKTGETVTRMSQAFTPPDGKIITVQVAAILARQKKPGTLESLRCEQWEVVLPEFLYFSEKSQEFR